MSVWLEASDDVTAELLGKTVEILAPDGEVYKAHELHEQTARVEEAGKGWIRAGAHVICWAARENVQLKEVESE